VIRDLDEVLRELLLQTFDEPAPNPQWVRFQPPDDTWRQYVSGLNHPALNVYLVDIRENRKLRSNETVRTYNELGAVDRRAPRRVSCHYLITAWHHATIGPQFDPTPDEHHLLYRAIGLLMNEDPFVPEKIHPATALPDQVKRGELPIDVVPIDGFPKYAEFWGTFGQVHPWKPAVYLTVTLPVVLTDQFAGPMVTTRITEYRRAGQPETAEVRVQIGGQLTNASGEAVEGAWVSLESTSGEVQDQVTTDRLGRFTFNQLRKGGYVLRSRPAGLDEIVRSIEVPSPTGEYDLSGQ
jgi:Pvc16 N-terminal domain/Carboxypeptidase regulatory-like domain